MITLTQRAIKKAITLAQKEGKAPILRLGVKGGGCSGLSYVVEFADTISDEDTSHEIEGLTVVCDLKSLEYLSELTLDFETNLLKSGWRFINPQASKSCSCGESFSL